MSAAGQETTLGLKRVAVRSLAGPNRPENQDRALADSARGLLVVADGMGSLPLAMASAAQASSMVSESLEAGSDGPALREAVRAAGDAVVKLARGAGVQRAGTTLCVALVNGHQLLVAHVGDSRCYLVRDGRITKLTTDHTAAARLIADGAIEDGSSAAADLAHRLDRYLGRSDSEPDLESYDVQHGDRLLVCSDGVHQALGHDELAEVLVGSAHPGEVADRLVDAARDAGGTDDATAVVADIARIPTSALSLSSGVGGVVLAPGELATVGRAGEGPDIGFSDPAVHARAAVVTADELGWILQNTGRHLVAVVRDLQSSMKVEVPPLRSLRVPFARAQVVFTTKYGEHSFVVDCSHVTGLDVVIPTNSRSGTAYSYPFDRTSAQFRTLVAICETELLGQKRKRFATKALRKRLQGVEPDVTLRAVSRRIDELSGKILGSGTRDLPALAERAIHTGTVTRDDLKLLGGEL